MSRYQLPHNRYDIVVGWDRALETFFAIAADTEADSDSEEVIIWLGTTSHEFREVDLFLEAFVQELHG
ncbi:MAG: hypothetical protein AAF959_09995 [Cyanobacteria bacterium P01_D01_bin.56]